ncbi:MAG: OST-HTH/LOTUS domain-containing protein, partial [Actinobacteria bacterium]|nr:OST-HTH/LOTUS domain-containing protein [Actinomycetota bacterium]
PDLRKLLTSAIDATSAEDGWAHLGSVGSYLGTRHASFDPRNYGFAKLISLARAQDYVEVEQTDDNATRVRLTGGKGPAAKATKATTAKKTAAAKAPAKKSSSRGRGRGSGQSNG